MNRHAIWKVFGRPLTVIALAIAPLAVGPPALAQQAGELRVRVVATDGTPADDADVRILGLGRVSHTDGAGEVAFPGVPAGTYLVEAESQRYGRGVERAVLEPGGSAEVEVTVSLLFHAPDIVVSAGGEGVLAELYSPASVMRGIDLRAGAQASLGETLAEAPGVSSSYHGPGSSRPIIRGLGGDRVRVLESGVGSGDASNTSPDHAPGVEAMIAERIEIIRGPATLLYGSSAIGGVVNIEDGRVPKELPAHPLTGSVILRGGTVADERNGAVVLNGAAGSIAYHASGLWRETDDYAIPGHAEAHHEEEPAGDEGEENILPNSAVETARFAAGVSYVGGNGFLGLAYSGYDSDYGVPGGHGHEEEGADGAEEEGDVGIDLQQRRVDVESGWRFGGSFLKGISARLGVADYRHFEVIANDETGTREIETRFFNDEWEGRLELQHAIGSSATGALGMQLRDRDFEAIGEEAFVPPTSTSQVAVFLYEQFDFGALGVQAGVRLEHQSTTNETGGVDRTDDGVSASLGFIAEASEAVSFVVNGSRSAKLPTAEELFSDGPHLATLQFEVGDPDLEQEVGYSLDAGVRLVEGRVRGELTFFVNSFDHFIFQAFTGEERDDLPVSRWSQGDALFTGFEGRADVELFHAGNGHVVLDAWGEYVRAELTETDEPLPRIPPFGFGAGLGYEAPTWHGHVGVRRVTSQDRVASFEEETAGYTLWNASLGYRLFSGRLAHDIVLSATNLTDQEARSHTSFLKELAPLPGREVRLTYQLSF